MCLRQNERDDKHVSVRLIISKTLFFNHRLFIIFRNTVARKDYYYLLQAQHEDKTSPDISVLSRGSKVYSKFKIKN